MNKIKATLIVVMLLTGLIGSFRVKIEAQAVTLSTPNGLVADLYKVHNQKRGPFHPGHSALLYKYFDKRLADMIHKDAVVSAAKHDVGVIEGDPLYDAQDFEIKNFAIGQASYESGKAKVPVTFENIGEKKTLIFVLVNSRSGWRISDIDYGEGRTLVGEFKETK
jgi:hypothetical protein